MSYLALPHSPAHDAGLPVPAFLKELFISFSAAPHWVSAVFLASITAVAAWLLLSLVRAVQPTKHSPTRRSKDPL